MRRCNLPQACCQGYERNALPMSVLLLLPVALPVAHLSGCIMLSEVACTVPYQYTHSDSASVLACVLGAATFCTVQGGDCCHACTNLGNLDMVRTTARLQLSCAYCCIWRAQGGSHDSLRCHCVIIMDVETSHSKHFVTSTVQC
jgi:hypothetical protein